MNRRSFALFLKCLLGGAAGARGSAAVAAAEEAADGAQSRRRFLVIGAGLAGLAAARELQAMGHEVLVLEGRDRTGGRIHTSRQWSDLPLDLGATWIHGARGNPLTSLAKEAGAELLTTRYRDAVGYNSDGSPWSANDEERLGELRDRIYELIELAQDAEADLTLREALRQLTGPDASADTRRLVDFSFTKATGKPVLLGFLAADAAIAAEKLPDGELVGGAMRVLKTIFGNGIPDPVDYQITRWASDPLARGSYSFNAVNSTPAMRRALAEPLEGRLFFAGEATERKFFGTAHGAYLSGLRAAAEAGR